MGCGIRLEKIIRGSSELCMDLFGSNDNYRCFSVFQSVLPAWHNQLLVYWAGKDVIICLAKDSKPNSTSTLFVSQDYGGKFINVTDQLVLKDKSPPALEKFFNHPKNTGLVS